MNRPITVIALITLLFGAGMISHAQTLQPYQQPILITSAGQSADVTLAGSLCKKAGLEAKVIPAAAVADLKGFKTLMIVAGFSSKGLGAAGTSREQELERVKKLIAAAREAKLPILTLHIGGKARRGTQSDDFNKMAAEAAQSLIVVKQGNDDGFFTKIAGEHKAKITVADKIAGVVAPLGAAFK
ncbi:MAG TPA: DUF6305 family protein [Bacteroidota bacterium]|nr:DUF6305 family protein [Bacteroidota bacterium]